MFYIDMFNLKIYGYMSRYAVDWFSKQVGVSFHKNRTVSDRADLAEFTIFDWLL